MFTQVSSPLPDQTRRIYDRGHAHSRSWNPECPSPPMNHASYHYYRNETEDLFPMMPMPLPVPVPIINEPPIPLPVESIGRTDNLRRNVPRQAKSFDDRVAEDRRRNLAHRSYTMSDRRREDPDDVSTACQTLWAAKGQLEQLQALGISEPSSVSTSFDSNTDSQATTETAERSPAANAKGKRLQYKSLLLQRQFLSTAAISSMDSNNSTDSSGPPVASSFDSTRSELEQRRLSLMNHGDQNNDFDPTTAFQRDYCVDAKTDSLFREWSRVDPAYESVDSRRLQRGQTVDHSSHQHLQQPRRFPRQHTLAGPSPLMQSHAFNRSLYGDV
ncbi:unnamed protein product [Caenorhabditis auriculariae]|uniref:Uncharacterized protein n=1 Tax=Caenorhabditis auriculariae TaxID=2777116 RepID=A0A8S1HG73_9PELO|nr:unnamed protein product [Caenorhabditis auriculariae]